MIQIKFTIPTFLTLFSLSLNINNVKAQVSISPNNAPPNGSAMLDVQSSNKGFLPPRMTTNQRRAIPNPIAGLIVYDTDRQTLFFYNGNLWKALIAEAAPLSASINGVDVTDGAAGDALGVSVDIYGNYAIVGAYRDDIGSNTNQGSAYIYKLENGNWLQMQKLTANDGQPNDEFGGDVVMDSSYAFVSAPYANIGSGTDQGCVYAYKLENGVWVQKQKIISINAASGDLFGGLSYTKGFLAIGASKDDVGFNNDQGAAYIFSLDTLTGTWNEMQKLTANDGTAGDTFGYAVSIDSDKIIVAAINDDVNGSSQRGSAYIFTLQSGIWVQTTKLIANDGNAQDFFGRSATIKGDYALVGSYFSDITATNQGAAYLFKLENGSWTQKQKIVAFDPAINANFGTSVALKNNFAVIGAQQLNGFQGAAYLFQLNPSTNVMTQIQKITAADGATYDYFGFSTALDNYTILIGAYGKNGERGRIYFKTID